MLKAILTYARDDTGSVYIEYGMIALMVGVVVLSSVGTLSDIVAERYNTISAAFGSGQSTR